MTILHNKISNKELKERLEAETEPRTTISFYKYFNKLIEADGILLGSPVYSADVSANMKAFLERAGVIVASNPELIKYKVGAAVGGVGFALMMVLDVALG